MTAPSKLEYIIYVLEIPENEQLCHQTVEILEKVVSSRKQQLSEQLPYIDFDMSEDFIAEAENSASSRKFSKQSDLVPKIGVKLLTKVELKNLTGREKPSAILIAKDLSCKLLVKYLSKILQLKHKQSMQLIFMGTSVPPCLNRDHPQNCKNCLKFWDFPKCQTADVEEGLKEFLNHLNQFHDF